MSTSISIRVSDEIASRLAEISRETERSKSFHVREALDIYLSDLADLQVAYDRLHNTTDQVVSIEDMRKDLEL